MKLLFMVFQSIVKMGFAVMVRILVRSHAGNTFQEVMFGIRFLKTRVLPTGVKMSIFGNSKFYEKYGFYVPLSCGEVFSKWNGIRSDRYMSMDVYYFYAIPALNRYDFHNGLVDKGFYSTLFPDILKPRTIINNRNGIYYDGDNRIVAEDAALKICEDLPKTAKFIIKPTVTTACGKGIGLLDASNIYGQFGEYGRNFIVQEKVAQHPVMAALNESSLNTLRLYTYRDIGKNVHFVDECALVRIGGKGSIKDNVSAGGGFCALGVNGEVSDRFLRERSFEVRSLAEAKGFKNLVIPNYQEAKSFVCSLHDRLPYFDWIGWDIGIDPKGNPIFIEFNLVPFVEGPQMAHGPMFGRYLDEVMNRVKVCRTRYKVSAESIFDHGFRRFDGIVRY